MAKMNEKQALLLASVATVLVCAGAGAGVWWASGLVEEEKVAIQDKRAKVAAARKKIAKIPEVERDVIVLRENVDEYVKILPQERELTNFTRTAQNFAAQSGFALDTVRPVRTAGSKAATFEKVSYQFEFSSSLWQFMKFMNFFENYARFVKVQDFKLAKINSARPGQGEGLASGEDKIHKLSITVETYVYNAKATGKGVVIQNYDNKRNALRHEITSSLQDLVMETYEFKGAEGRRDIFLDPRQSSRESAEGNSVISQVEQKKLIEAIKLMVFEESQRWTKSKNPGLTVFQRFELQNTVRQSLRNIEERVEDVTEKGLISLPALRVRWYKDVLNPLKELTAEVREIQEDLDKYLSKEEFETLIEKIKADLTTGDLETAVNRYNTVQANVAVPADDARYGLRVQVEGLLLRARVALEFSAMRLEIAGVMVNYEGKSGVILNGEVYQEGEFLSDSLFIKAVRREEVEFVFKGFTLVKTW